MRPRIGTRILYDNEIINRTVSELAYKITNDYKNNDRCPIFIIILNGAMHFAVELTKRLDIECEIDTITVKSYQGQSKTTTTITKHLDTDYTGRDVIVIDDICDSGETLMVVKCILGENDLFAPKSIKTCCLCYKQISRHLVDYAGLVIDENQWIFGYGMDFDGQSRHLINIYTSI